MRGATFKKSQKRALNESAWSNHFAVMSKAKTVCQNDLLLYQNGVLSPIEIKKAASPGKTAIKNFDVLEPVTRAEAFGGLESLRVEIGTGSVVCMANDLLPVNEKNWYVPVWLI